VVLPVLGLVILYWFLLKYLFGHDAFVAAHGCILQVELCVFDAIQRLLLRFSHEDLGKDIL
jgi:hypothetical protein